MKKFKLLTLFLAAISMITLSSCEKEKETYWQAIGTLQTVNSTSSLTLIDDNGITIKLVESPFVLSTEYEGKRASVTFIRTDEVVGENDKVMNGRLVFMDFIDVVSPTSLSQYGDEATIKKELGQQYITPVKAWFGGGYINMIYRAGFSNLSEKRKVSLAIDTEKSTSTEIFASLYYKADDANDEYYYNNFAEGMVDFDMRNFIYGDKVVTVTISYINAEMRSEDVIIIKSDNSITKAPSSVSAETIKFTQK